LFYQIANDFTGFSSFEDDKQEESKNAEENEHVISDDLFDRHFMKGHKGAITCLDWALDNKSIFTGSKDCSIIKCK